MPIPPESIGVGRCYLARSERGVQVRRVLQVMPDGRVRFERQVKTSGPNVAWVGGLADRRALAHQAICEVPCDWTPDGEQELGVT